MQIPIAIPAPNLLFVFIIPVLLMDSFYTKNLGYKISVIAANHQPPDTARS